MTKRRLRRKNKPYKSSNKAKFEGLSVVEVTGFEFQKVNFLGFYGMIKS